MIDNIIWKAICDIFLFLLKICCSGVVTMIVVFFWLPITFRDKPKDKGVDIYPFLTVAIGLITFVVTLSLLIKT